MRTEMYIIPECHKSHCWICYSTLHDDVEQGGVGRITKCPPTCKYPQLIKIANKFGTIEDAVRAAIATNDIPLLSSILDGGFPINNKKPCPLVYASLYGILPAVVFLLERGADVTATDEYDANALTMVINGCDRTGNGFEVPVKEEVAVDIIAKLFDYGMTIEESESDSLTSQLHFAARLGLTKIARLLVGVGADKTMKDHRGLTPMEVAAENGHLETKEALEL